MSLFFGKPFTTTLEERFAELRAAREANATAVTRAERDAARARVRRAAERLSDQVEDS